MRKKLLYGAMVLSGAQLLVRLSGMGMKVALARMVEPGALGLYELALSNLMLFLTPFTAGLPLALSQQSAKLVARGDPEGARWMLLRSRRWVLVFACALSALLAPLMPLMARQMGDDSLAPVLLACLPLVPVLALSALHNGYFFGLGRNWPAALQMIEQGARIAALFGLLSVLGGLGDSHDAALIMCAGLPGAVIALAVSVLLARGATPAERRKGPASDAAPTSPARAASAFAASAHPASAHPASAHPASARAASAHPTPARAAPALAAPARSLKPLARAAWPMTLSRVLSSAVRSLSTMLLPSRLMLAGMTGALAIAEYGKLAGMVMPFLMLPHVFIGPLCQLATPRIACSTSREAQRSLSHRVLLGTLALSAAFFAAMLAAGPTLMQLVFDEPSAGALLRAFVPQALLGGMAAVASALLCGLGLEKRALRVQVCGGLVTLALAWWLSAMPALQLYGLAVAMAGGSLVSMSGQLTVLFRALSADRQERSDMIR